MFNLIKKIGFIFILASCMPENKEDTSTNTDSGVTDTADSSDSSNGSDGSNGGDTNDTSSPTEDCTQAGDFNACATCFTQQNPTGASIYNTAVTDHCICANECIVECAAACEDPAGMNEACNTCVNTTGADTSSQCFTGFAADCSASADCTTFSQQLQTCPQ